MTQIEVPDWVVERALHAVPFAEEGDTAMVWQQLGYSNEHAEKIMRAALTAALGAWVVTVHQIATPEPDWRDINAQHFRMIKGSTAKTRTLYDLRQEKPE